LFLQNSARTQAFDTRYKNRAQVFHIGGAICCQHINEAFQARTCRPNLAFALLLISFSLINQTNNKQKSTVTGWDSVGFWLLTFSSDFFRS
jgi:hypothetical protein